jgi:NAD(P)-dependent dehydrogenase (short-subunit alcohol dehydrogenase family)
LDERKKASKGGVMALDGQKVIVIGGSSGIGRGAAAGLLGREAHVVLFGRSLDRSRRPAPSRELGNASGVGFEIMLILIEAALLLIALKQTHPRESGLKRVPQRELSHEVSRSDSRI